MARTTLLLPTGCTFLRNLHVKEKQKIHELAGEMAANATNKSQNP